MSLLTFSCSSKAQKQTTDTGMQSDKKILVAYFSCTGTTEKIAGAIAQAVNGKLYRITPAVAYTSADLNWNNKASRSSVEMADEKFTSCIGWGDTQSERLRRSIPRLSDMVGFVSSSGQYIS